jgi:hypothetical protein
MISKISKHVFTLAYDGEIVEASSEEIMNCTLEELPYVGTVYSWLHKCGKITEKFIIGEYLNEVCDPEWVHTAYTRTTDTEHVFWFNFDLKWDNIANECKKMVRGYRAQDKQAGRELVDFVTEQSIMDKFRISRKCQNCGEGMSFNTHAKHKVTCQRLDNSPSGIRRQITFLCA